MSFSYWPTAFAKLCAKSYRRTPPIEFSISARRDAGVGREAPRRAEARVLFRRLQLLLRGNMPRFIRRYVEPVGIHDLRPCLHEVADKLFISALLGIDLAYGAEFGVRSKDQVGARRPPRLVPAGTVG